MRGSPDFPDHFSTQAADYARYRPHYPVELYSFLAGVAPALELAWDCGTGSGQAARGLANHFARVIATDASADQIANAAAVERVDYRVAPAERSGLPAASVDLVTVAQALHWFDVDAFFAEVRRVTKPPAKIAVWAYELTRIEPGIDTLVERYYNEVVGPYWPPEREHVERAYDSLPFPFAAESVPAFEMEAWWQADELLGYLSTWSASARYRQATGTEPVDEIATELGQLWGRAPRRVGWPLILKLARVHE